MQRGTGSQWNNDNILWNSWGQFDFLGFIDKMQTHEFIQDVSIWTMCWFLLSPTVLGTRGASEAGLWSHSRLVVLGLSTVRDAVWTGEKNLRFFKASNMLSICILVENPLASGKKTVCEQCELIFLFLHPASVLQSQHCRDVQQYPSQASGVKAQCVQRWPWSAGRVAAQGSYQETGIKRWLRKSGSCYQFTCIPFILRFVFLILAFFSLQLELKFHSFFSPINWDDLMSKKITPPFVPSVVSSTLYLQRCEYIVELWITFLIVYVTSFFYP